MKRFVGIVLAALLLVGLSVMPANAAWYWFQVKDEQDRAITSGFTCQVYTAASQEHDVVFADTQFQTQKTNPVNPDSNGVCSFATDATTVDVVVWGNSGDAQGAVARVKAISDKQHKVVLNEQQEVKHLRFFWDRNISKGAEVNTGITLPVGAVVLDAFLEVATGYPNVRVSVGLLSTEASGNAAGFCASAGADYSFAPSYFRRCEASRGQSLSLDLATAGKFFWSSNTRGIFLASYSGGGTLPPIGGNLQDQTSSIGQYAEYFHMVEQGAAKTLTYTTNDPPTIGQAAAGYVHIFYRELRAR